MNFHFRPALAVCLVFAASIAFGSDKPTTISLINGKNLAGWKTIGHGPCRWTFGKAAPDPDAPSKLKVTGPGGELIGTNRTVNLSSKAVFGDCIVELEFMVGKSVPRRFRWMDRLELASLGA